MSRPILNIVDERVVLTLTVQDGAAAAAAASAAAAAASEVETGLDRVATGEDVTAAEAAAAAAEVAKIEWQGDWVAGTYQIHDAVAYLGSSWIANKITAEVPSLIAVDWDLLAERGTDGDSLPVGAENDLLQANGAGVFVPYTPPITLESIRNKLAPLAYPDDKLIFWDDFISPTGELNGRLAPSGQAWEVVNVTTMVPVLGEFSVTNSTALKTSNTFDIAALQPITNVRGITIEGIFTTTSSQASAVNFVIFDNLNNWVRFSIGNNRTIAKSVSGVVTTISTSPNFSFPFDGASNAKSVFKADLSIVYQGATNNYPVSFGANGQNYNIVISDAEAKTILNNAVKIGFGGFKGHSSYGIRLISGI